MADALLELEHVSAGYADDTVLDDISFSVGRGESLAVLGRNGVGKSTLMLTIMGHTRQKRGRLLLRGEDISSEPPHVRVLRGLAWSPQEREVFVSLTVEENLRVAARRGDWTVDAAYSLFPRLRERRQNLGRQLSGGEQQMLSIARALVTNPDLILLDEPLEGLAPNIVAEVEACIRRIMSQSGTSLLLAEQHSGFALGVTDQALILERGRAVFLGPSDALAKDGATLEAFVGVRKIAARV